MFEKRPAPATLIALVALGLSLGGTSYAATQVGTAQLKNDAVTAAKIRSGSVRTAELGAAAVTGVKLADGAVGTTKLADGTVGTTKLADTAVGTTKLADAAVVTGKLVDAAVNAAKLATAAVTTTKLADAAVTGGKVADASLTGADLAPGSVTAANVAPGAFITGSGTTHRFAGTITSGSGELRILSTGGFDLLATCTSQKLKTIAKAFAPDVSVVNMVAVDGQPTHVAAGELSIGGVAAAAQVYSDAVIGTVQWQASWTDAAGTHVRTAWVSYRPVGGGCAVTVMGVSVN